MGGNGESDAFDAHAQDFFVDDANEGSALVNQRTSAVARADADVGLNQGPVRILALAGNDTLGHRGPEVDVIGGAQGIGCLADVDGLR